MRALLRYLFSDHQRAAEVESITTNIITNRGGLQMFHGARLLHSHKAWRGDYAVRAGVIGLSLTLALAIYFLSPLRRRAAFSPTPTLVHDNFEDAPMSR